MEVDQEPVRWQAKPCGWHRKKGALKQKALSLTLTATLILIALDTAALEQIYKSFSLVALNQRSEIVLTDPPLVSRELEIDLRPKTGASESN